MALGFWLHVPPTHYLDLESHNGMLVLTGLKSVHSTFAHLPYSL